MTKRIVYLANQLEHHSETDMQMSQATPVLRLEQTIQKTNSSKRMTLQLLHYNLIKPSIKMFHFILAALIELC
jgi:hypothetical protein